MFSEVNYKGDEGYIAEDLFGSDRELESRCFAITKAVREGYFSISEALPLYEVSEPQYAAYLLLHSGRLQSTDKAYQFAESFKIVAEVFQSVISAFDSRKRQIIDELQDTLH